MPASHEDDRLDGPAPAYPQQPVAADRPVTLRGRPERTQEPEDWSSGSGEPVSGAAGDPGAEELSRRSRDERAAHADGRARVRAPHDDDESSYTTEQEQGAAQPGPDDV